MPLAVVHHLGVRRFAGETADNLTDFAGRGSPRQRPGTAAGRFLDAELHHPGRRTR
jgi:hypothetical protein